MPQSRSGTGTRPTTDRVRESLFNVLGARMDLAGVAVLDLYAGSGALGIEAVSRGAASVLFVESDRRAAAMITENLTLLGVVGAVRCADVAGVVAKGTGSPVGLVLADPPYEVPTADVEALVGALVDNGWAGPDTVAVFERPASAAPIQWPSGWTPLRERRYGDTRIEMAQREG